MQLFPSGGQSGRDPGFAAAYSGLADCYATLGYLKSPVAGR